MSSHRIPIYKNKEWRCLFSKMKRLLLHLVIALAFLCGAISFAQTNAEAFFYAGWSAFRAKNYNEALTNFTKSIELEPRNADTYNGRGRTKWWLQDYYGAIADYDIAICLNTQCGGYYCNRGQAKFALKMVPAALADYNKAIELDPTNTQAFFNRGTLKTFYLTNYTEAVADFTKAIDLHNDPNEEDIFFWRGNVRRELKDYAGAIADYSRAIELNTNSGWALALPARTNLDTARKQLLEMKKKNRIE